MDDVQLAAVLEIEAGVGNMAGDDCDLAGCGDEFRAVGLPSGAGCDRCACAVACGYDYTGGLVVSFFG